MIVGVITLLVSQTLLFSNQAGPIFLVIGVVFLLYVLWGPIVEAGRRNATLRRYPVAAIFEGEVADFYTKAPAQALGGGVPLSAQAGLRRALPEAVALTHCSVTPCKIAQHCVTLGPSSGIRP